MNQLIIYNQCIFMVKTGSMFYFLIMKNKLLNQKFFWLINVQIQVFTCQFFKILQHWAKDKFSIVGAVQPQCLLGYGDVPRSPGAIYLQLFTFLYWRHPFWLMIPRSVAEWLLAVTVVYSYTLKKRWAGKSWFVRVPPCLVRAEVIGGSSRRAGLWRYTFQNDPRSGSNISNWFLLFLFII